MCLLSGAWLVSVPGWESVITFVGSLGAYLGLELVHHQKKKKSGGDGQHEESAGLTADDKQWKARLVPVRNSGYSVDTKNGEVVCPFCADGGKLNYMKEVQIGFRCHVCGRTVSNAPE